MCGARKPRLALTTNDKGPAAVKIAPARNVVLVVENESSGQSGLPADTGASSALAS